MEKQQAIVSIAIALIVCLLGLPVWWHTTKAYRANLPYADIYSLADEAIPKINTKWEIFFDASIFSSESTSLMDEFAAHLEGTAKKNIIDFVTEVTIIESKISSKVKKLIDKFNRVPSAELFKLDNELLASIVNKEKAKCRNDFYYRIFFLKVSADSSEKQCPIVVGNSNIIVLVGNSGMLYLANCTKQLVAIFNDVFLPRRMVYSNIFVNKNPPINTTSTQAAAGYEISFTLANANPHEVVITWGMEYAVKNQLQRFLSSLSVLGPYFISSQVLNFVDVAISPRNSHKGYYYTMKQLPLLLNPLESRLNTYTSNRPILNFVLYTPPLSQMPLVIKSKNRKEISFISPRWGGVVFNNIDDKNSNLSGGRVKFNLDLRKEMLLFIGQIRELMGLKRNPTDGVLFSTFDQSVVMQWEVNYLLLSKSFENIAKSVSTLISLANLLEQIANIIIREDVKELIVNAVNEVNRAKMFLRNGSLENAFLASKSALNFSEQAFFDHSLLALLYFPDDQKYAIYLPLFLPVCVPIFISMIGAFKIFKTCIGKTKKE